MTTSAEGAHQEANPDPEASDVDYFAESGTASSKSIYAPGKGEDENRPYLLKVQFVLPREGSV